MTRKAERDVLSRVIGQKVKQLRSNRRITQANFGGRIGVSRACVAQYEAGSIAIPLATLYKMAYHLDVDITALIPENHPVPPKPPEPEKPKEMNEAQIKILLRMSGALL